MLSLVINHRLRFTTTLILALGAGSATARNQTPPPATIHAPTHQAPAVTTPIATTQPNLLLNPDFSFDGFNASRVAEYRRSNKSGSVPFWDQDAYGDITVYRPSASPDGPPAVPVDGVAVLEPGQSLSQFRLLSDMRVKAGDALSLSVYGKQAQPDALQASLFVMLLDKQDGEWTPADYDQSSTKKFPRQARGEMTPEVLVQASASEAGNFFLTLPQVTIPAVAGSIAATANHAASEVVAIRVQFTNTSTEPISIYAPSLTGGSRAPVADSAAEAYRHLPRTIAKLRAGKPLHVIVMGSSIDRGSANPPMYRYDEDPHSPQFKQPVSSKDFLFDGQAVGHPEWTPYFGQWRHFFSYAGRWRQAMMRRYDYPIEKILLNFMASDGSSIGESHSAIPQWTGLQLPPDPENNGHRAGGTWQQLYPDFFTTDKAPEPDLVIFGSGANEKIDGEDEIAAFEGAIRWFQRNHPGVEFIFCMWSGSDTPNASMLKELSLRYGIPFIDFGKTYHLAAAQVDPLLLTPRDGHPQAAAHDLWARALESAFQPTDPIAAGYPQQYLPERASPYTIGWEGEIATYDADSPRIRKHRGFILDDTVANLWAHSTEKNIKVFVNGLPSTDPRFGNKSRLRNFTKRNPRNSSFVIGRLPLGERHIIEVGETDTITAVDAKQVLNRNRYGVEQPLWQLPRKPETFTSEWGAPYGTLKAVLKENESATLTWTGTDLSIAWLEQPGGGELVAKISGNERLRRDTGKPTLLSSKEEIYMENRAGILNLPYGVHQLEIEAKGGNVDLLGVFTYDTRANANNTRTVQGIAAPGETVHFNPPFRATPVIITGGGIKVQQVSNRSVTFTATGELSGYQAIGE